VISFTPRAIYLLGESSRYHPDRRMDGSQSRSARDGKEKNLSIPATKLVDHHYSDWDIPITKVSSASTVISILQVRRDFSKKVFLPISRANSPQHREADSKPGFVKSNFLLHSTCYAGRCVCISNASSDKLLLYICIPLLGDIPSAAPTDASVDGLKLFLRRTIN
jgi:hypothetical protein